MDPGEQTTGTRDEHYDLISVLYHALQGAEAAETYAIDAEAAGDERLAAFFREAQDTHRQLAEQAKVSLGIDEAPPETGVPPEGITGGVPRTEAGGIPPEGITGGMPPEIPPGAGAAGTLPGGAGFPGTEPISDEAVLEDPAGELPPEPVEVPPASSGEMAEAGGVPAAGGTREYQQTGTVDAPPDEVFAWLSDVGNLPRYLPPITDADLEGPSGDRVWLRGEIPNRGTFENEGYFRVDEAARRMDWGAEVYRDYSGWLAVAENESGTSQVTVHLSFGEVSVEPEIQEESGPDRDPLEEALAATLESVRRQIEEGAGKVQPPPPE